MRKNRAAFPSVNQKAEAANGMRNHPAATGSKSPTTGNQAMPSNGVPQRCKYRSVARAGCHFEATTPVWRAQRASISINQAPSTLPKVATNQ